VTSRFGGIPIDDEKTTRRSRFGGVPLDPPEEKTGFFDKAGAAVSAFADEAVGTFSQSVGGLSRFVGEDTRGAMSALSPFVSMQKIARGIIGDEAVDENNPVPATVPGLTQFGRDFADTDLNRQAQLTRQANGIDEDSLLASATRMGGSVGAILPSLAVGVATRSPTLATAAMLPGTFGSEYQEGRETLGLDTEEAKARAGIMTGVEAAFERLGLKYVLPKQVKEGVAKTALEKVDELIDSNWGTKVAGAAGVGLLEETGATLTQMGLDEGLGYRDYTAQDYKRGLQDAAVGGTLMSGGIRAGTAVLDTKFPDTGVEGFDAGKNITAAMQERSKATELRKEKSNYVAPDNKDTNLNEGPKMPDLFSRTPDVPAAQDMFSGELRAVNPRIPDEDVPVRSEQRQAELESDYIFQQQEKLKEEVRRRMLARKERELSAVDTSNMGMGNIVREGQPTSVSERPDLVRRKITDDTINELGFSDVGKNILTREGNPLSIDEWRLLNKEIETRMSAVMGSTTPVRNNTTMADAFDRAGLRRNTGLLEERGFESEATYPNARGGVVQQPQDGPEVFEPSRVPQAEGRTPVQQQIEMPERGLNETLSQPGLFDTPQQASTPQPVAPTTTTVATPATDISAILRERNERSVRDTGQPLSPDQVSAITRGEAARVNNLPASAVATSPVDQMMIEFEDEAEVNEQISERLAEDAGLRAVVDQEVAKGSEGSVSNILRAVANTKGASEYQKKLAHVLEMSARNLGIKMVTPAVDPVSGEATRLDPTELGAYSAIDNSIRIRSANPETILHEVAHGVSKAILADKALQAANPKIAQTVQDFSDLLATVKLETEKRSDLIDQYPKLKAHLTRYGTKNIDEFFTMSMTNPEFQKFLSSIKDPNSKGEAKKSLWQMFKDAVKKLLGLGRLEGSALDRAMERTFEIADFARRNPEQVKEATKRVGEKIKTRVQEQRAAKGEDQMTLPKSEPKRKIPKDRGDAVNTAQRILGAKWGRIFGKDAEKAQGEIYAGKEVAQRVYKQFDAAGYPKLSDADKRRVSLAMDGKADISNLSPKMQQAVKDYRARVMTEQLRLAAESNDEGLKKMIYDSMVRGDYSTRAFAAFDLKPDTMDAVMFFAHKLLHKGETPKPYWLWKQEKDAPAKVRALESYIRDNLIIPDIDSIPEGSKAILASFYGMRGTEEEIDAKLREERARLGADEATQVENLMRILSDPLTRENADVRLQKQAARDMTILMHRTDVPKPLREFWGEFNQAPLKGAMTMSRLTKLVAQTKMINNIVMDGVGNYLFPPGMQAKAGYTTQLPNTDSMGALAGMYTRPDIAKQLETIVDSTSGHAQREFAKAAEVAWNAWTKIIMPTKVAKTVMNVPTAAANFYASTTAMPNFLMRAALMGQPVKGLGTMLEAVKNAAFDMTGHLDEKTARKWIEAGVLREGIQLGELNDMIQQYEWDAQSQSGSKTAKVVRQVGRGLGRTMDAFSGFYQLPDNMLRLYAAAIEFNIQKSIYPDKSDRELLDIAADRARDQVPTWNRASPLVRRVGTATGSFPTFFSEIFRTIPHQIVQAGKDFSEGWRTKNPKLMQYGVAQAMGVSSQIFTLKTTFPLLIAAMMGFDDEQDEGKQQALEASLPDFQRGQGVSLMHVDPKTMRAVYTNTDRIDLAGPINTTIGRLRQTKELSDVPGELLDVVIQAAGMGPGAQAWRDAITGTDQYGRKLSGEERVEAVGTAYLPGSLAWMDRLQGMRRRGVDERVISAGKAGLPLYELDTKNDLKFASLDFNRDIGDAENILQRAIGKVRYDSNNKIEPLTTEELRDHYIDFLTREREAFDKLSQRVQGAKTLYGDATRLEISNIFKDARLRKVYRDPLQSGKFQSRTFDPKFLENSKMKALEQGGPQNKAEIEKRFKEIEAELKTLRKDFTALLGD
jgi:hypothetical protein